MDPSILVSMKKSGDLLSSYRKSIYKNDLFRILDYVNSLEESDNEIYGTVVIDYTESSFVGCKIKSDLTIEQYYNLYDSVKSFRENKDKCV